MSSVRASVYKVNTQKSVTFLYTNNEYMNTVKLETPFITPKIN